MLHTIMPEVLAKLMPNIMPEVMPRFAALFWKVRS